MRTSLVLTLIATLALAIPASTIAEGCEGRSNADVDAGGIYVATDDICVSADVTVCAPGSAVVYQESNGIEGLQRADTRADDTCDGEISPDTQLA